MPTQREKIIKKVLEVLENKPNGVRYSELHRKIKNTLPKVNFSTIHGTLWYLKQKIDNGQIKNIIRPERGLYILKKYLEDNQPNITTSEKSFEINGKAIVEENFYKPFADYLVKDLEECTKAIPLGGNQFGDKWGTPDVFGIYKFSETDPLRPPIEIVSVEIKADTNQLITAFGQACSYKIFSHKVYLVIPKEAERDISRIESLCSKFSIGLILFDKNDSQNPKFEIRTRSAKSEPDYFYVNKYLHRIGDNLKKLF